MKQTRFSGFVPAFCLLALPALVHAQSANSLSLSHEVGEFGSVVDVDVTMTSDSQVQGLVAVAKWDTAALTGLELIAGPALDVGDGADTVITAIDDDHFVLGVVMDSNPTDNGGASEVIPPGEDLLIATLRVQCGSGPDETTTELQFADGEFPAAAGGPVLDNVIVVGGLSIGAGEGLGLNNGSVRCVSAPDRFFIQDGGAEGVARVMMNNNSEVEGFVTVVCHDEGLTLTGIQLGADAVQADFTAFEIEPDVGGAFGVVIDLFDPMASPPNIQPGQNRHIATYSYRCDNGQDGSVFGLRFCDGEIGSPLKDNLVVVGGLSITAEDGLVLTDGQFTCAQAQEPERGANCFDGIDNDGDGLIDADDPDCQTFDFEFVDPKTLEPSCVPAQMGTPVEALLAYTPPTRESLGLPGTGVVATQGFSLAFAFDCGQVEFGDTFDPSGTILEAVGAEFIGVQADNDASDVDGDGCSFVLAVLVDALPPFEGGVIPAIPQRQPLGKIEVTALEGTECGETIEVVPQDRVNGLGKVPVFNLISVDNLPYPTSVRPLCITLGRAPLFYRGDCNFTGRTRGFDPVELSDASSVISFLFYKSIFKFHPPCLDACDANDDGRIDLADAVAILSYLYVPGSPFPPAPGPGITDDGLGSPTPAGLDPTEDPLDCRVEGLCD